MDNHKGKKHKKKNPETGNKTLKSLMKNDPAAWRTAVEIYIGLSIRLLRL